VKDHTPVLVLNGSLEWTAAVAAIARRGDPLYAADGGANALSRLGLRPQCVIGDLDSISAATRAWLGEDRLVHRPDQNHTDFAKALRYLYDEIGLTSLTVLGAIGDRVDQTASNLGLLARHARGPDLILRTDRQMVLATSQPLELEATPGETWSFWSFDSTTRVSLGGVAWPLTKHPVGLAAQPSISNRASCETVRVVPRGGVVVVSRILKES
jgi:thiamine pyrophosphokinase